jgi:hypothetical protein
MLITTDEILNLKCSIDNEMHILRHFSTIPKSYYNSILNKHFLEWDIKTRSLITSCATPKKINSCLLTVGSKFNSEEYPELTPIKLYKEIQVELLRILKTFEFDSNLKENSDLIFVEKFKNEFYLQAILPQFKKRFCNLVHLDNLSSSEKLRVYNDKRGFDADAYIVKMFDANKLISCEDLVINIKKTNETDIFLISAYNGIKTPMFPNITFQTEIEYEKSLDFWNNHVFIKLI